ncbi:MAG: PilX N-terminal domain-containing pilus assembly protein [Lysobacterales bacterium]
MAQVEKVADGVQSMTLAFHRTAGGTATTYEAAPSDYQYVNAVRVSMPVRGVSQSKSSENRNINRTYGRYSQYQESFAMNRQYPSHKQQQGMSLLVVLILLVVMSILGVAVMRGFIHAERMAANLRDRSLATQAAEAALAAAQDYLNTVQVAYHGAGCHYLHQR